MRDRLMRADEAGAKLHARRTHFQIGGDCLAPRDSARDEDRRLIGKGGEDFLRKHRCGDRPDMAARLHALDHQRSEEHTSELQSLMRISYAVFCLKKKNKPTTTRTETKLRHHTPTYRHN